MFLPAPRSLSVSLFLFRVACLHYLLVTFSSTSSKSYQRVYLIALGSCRLPSNRISYLGLSRGSLRAEFYRVLAFAGSKTFPTPLFTFFPSPTCSLRPLQPAPILLINKHGVHENPIRKKNISISTCFPRRRRSFTSFFLPPVLWNKCWRHCTWTGQ